MKKIGEALASLALENERVAQFEVAIDDYDKVPKIINDFVEIHRSYWDRTRSRASNPPQHHRVCHAQSIGKGGQQSRCCCPWLCSAGRHLYGGRNTDRFLFGVNWLNFTPGGGEIVHAKMFSTWLVDVIMIPHSSLPWAVFALGLKRFISAIHANALLEGKTEKKTIDPAGFVQALIRVVPKIIKHNRFNECGENKERTTPT
jgi:hypothetical protein